LGHRPAGRPETFDDTDAGVWNVAHAHQLAEKQDAERDEQDVEGPEEIRGTAGEHRRGQGDQGREHGVELREEGEGWAVRLSPPPTASQIDESVRESMPF